MKSYTILSIVALYLTTKVNAACWSDKLGYPCCSAGNSVVYYTDADGKWGVENDNWCGIPKDDCWSEALGYPCCKTTTTVAFKDDSGNWGIENDEWCGIAGVSTKTIPTNPNPNPINTEPTTTAPEPTTVAPPKEEVINCSGKTLKSNTTLNIGNRKVIVQFPSGFSGDKPTPLLINYHPIMGSAQQWAGGSQTAKAALADGAIVAFMDGAQGPMGQAWNVGPCCTDADDVQFTRDFVKEITEKACVDPKRIYAAGFSMGGGMSNYAGCFLSDIIAAAAPSAFDLAKEITSAGKCKPSRPFPILNFRGTADNIVMYNGGLSQVVPGKPITFLGAKGNLAEWAKMNNCKGTPKTNTPGNNCEMYEDCDGGVQVGLCTIQGGGHGEGNGKMGWDFVKQFTLP